MCLRSPELVAYSLTDLHGPEWSSATTLMAETVISGAYRVLRENDPLVSLYGSDRVFTWYHSDGRNRVLFWFHSEGTDRVISRYHSDGRNIEIIWYHSDGHDRVLIWCHSEGYFRVLLRCHNTVASEEAKWKNKETFEMSIFCNCH